MRLYSSGGTYDAASRLSTRTDPKSQQISLGYNSRNDLTSVDYPTGTADLSFQYDGVRNRTQMVDATGTTSYSYDAVNRLTSVTFPGSRTVSYSYSNAGNRATMTYPGGSNQVGYGYDAASNLTSVTDWNSNQTQYAYDNAGQLTTITLPSGTGVAGTLSYDNGDRLTGVSWAKGGNTLASASYTLDAVSNRTQRVDQAGTHTYAYDALLRLTSVTYPGPSTDSYTYDANGNRLTKNSTNFTYDAADRLTAAGSTSYTYDPSARLRAGFHGNTTARGSDSFGWDPSAMLRTGAADRMTSATVASTTTTFAYNGDGLRDSRTSGGGTVAFTWDIASSIPEVIDDGSNKYILGLGRIAQIDALGNTYYYLADGLGSTMALVTFNGTVANTYDHDVFGAVRSSTGSQPNDFKFTGEQWDASTGLEYLRARYYDPAAGSFISRDSYGGSASQPLSQNRFAYAEGNPISNTDPSGMCIADSVYEKIKNLRDPFKGVVLATLCSNGFGHRRSEPSRNLFAVLKRSSRGWPKRLDQPRSNA